MHRFLIVAALAAFFFAAGAFTSTRCPFVQRQVGCPTECCHCPCDKCDCQDCKCCGGCCKAKK